MISVRPSYIGYRYNVLGSVEWWDVLCVGDCMADCVAYGRVLKLIYYMVNVKPTNTLTIQCICAQYSPTYLGILKYHNKGVRYEHAEMVPNVVGSREGWELYIVTCFLMVGISVCYSIQLTSFSASHDIGHLSQQHHV
jgi:hypothetical protein